MPDQREQSPGQTDGGIPRPVPAENDAGERTGVEQPISPPGAARPRLRLGLVRLEGCDSFKYEDVADK